MEQFVIEGGHPLKGSVSISGNKNAALPILAACLLTDEEVILENVPDIQDVRTMIQLLSDLGVVIEDLGPNQISVHAGNISKVNLSVDLCKKIRASILLAGPMLARNGQVDLPLPGGDVIGRRRVDTHLLALQALGASVEIGSCYSMRTNGLVGKDILLDEASVTATENALMAAATAKGCTTIRNAASEPHVQDLANFLNELGAQIEGIGSNTLVIHGVPALHGGRFRISPDYIETGSFIGLAAITHSEMLIKNAGTAHLRMILMKFQRLGVNVEIRGDDIFVPSSQPLEVVMDVHDAIPKIDDAPWPGFPADLMSIMLVVATQSRGTVLIHEKMFESRLFFVDKLISMGARIVLCDPHRAVVAGPSKLHGEQLESPDIRAGMALLIASLCATGTSVIGNLGQIDRGYERIEEKLQALGAHIERADM